METDYVRGRERFSQSSAEEEALFSVANELFEESDGDNGLGLSGTS
jgi:hypothetical protein